MAKNEEVTSNSVARYDAGNNKNFLVRVYAVGKENATIFLPRSNTFLTVEKSKCKPVSYGSKKLKIKPLKKNDTGPGLGTVTLSNGKQVRLNVKSGNPNSWDEIMLNGQLNNKRGWVRLKYCANLFLFFLYIKNIANFYS